MTIKFNVLNNHQRTKNILLLCLMLGLTACSSLVPIATPVITVPIADLLSQKRIGSGDAQAAAWSPDGKILAIATSLQIDLYDSKTLQLTATLDSADHSNGSLAFSADGKLLAVSDRDGATQIWDVTQRRILQMLKNNGFAYGPEPSLVFSPDGKKLFIGADQTINIWDTGNGTLLDSFPGQMDGIVGLALNREGTILLVASRTDISVRDLTTRQLLYQPIVAAQKGEFVAILLGLDGKHFTTVSYTTNLVGGWRYQSTISNWDLATGKLIDAFDATSDIIYSVAVSADQKRMALGGSNGASVWDVGKRTRFFSKDTGRWTSWVAVSPDGVNLLTISHANVQLWDMDKGVLLKTFAEYTFAVTDAAFSPDGHLVAVSDLGHKVQLRSLLDGKLLYTFDGNFPLAFSADGKTLALGIGQEQEVPMNEYSYNQAISLIDTSTGAKLPGTLGAGINCNAASAVAFSPNGRLLAYSGERNCPLQIVDLQSKLVLQTFGESSYNNAENLLFSPDGRKLIVRKYDAVEIWDAQSAKLLKTIDGIEYGAQIAISPDGRFLAISGFKASNKSSLVQIWDLVGNQHIFTLDTLQNSIDRLVFSSDKQVLAIGGHSYDQGRAQVEFWNTWSGQPLDNVEIPASEVIGLAFSPDGKMFLAAGKDGAIRTWKTQFAAASVSVAAPTSIPTQTATAPVPTLTISKIAELGKGISLKAYRSPDGKIIAQVDSSALKWFDAKTFALIGAVKIKENPSGRLFFSPDSKIVVSENYLAGEIIDLASKSVLGSVKGDNGYTSGYRFTKDDKYMAYLIGNHSTSASYHQIGLWDLTKRQDAFIEEESYFPTLNESNPHRMSDPAISPDGKLVAAGHSDKRVYVWDLHTGKTRFTLEGHTASVTSVDFSPDGRLLASASHDGTVRLWNPATGKLVRVLTGFQDDIQSIHFFNDSRTLEVQVENGPLQMVDLHTNEIKTAPSPTVTPDPFETQRYQQGYAATNFMFMSGRALYSPDGHLLALANNNVLVWDVSSGALLASLGDPEQGAINGIAFSPDGSKLAVVAGSGDVSVWEIKTGRQTLRARSEFVSSTPVHFGIGDSWDGPARSITRQAQGLAFSPDGAHLAFGNGNAIELWDVAQARKAQTLLNPEGTFATQVSFSADGKHLYAIINGKKAAQVWDVQTGKLLREVAQSSEDDYIFSASELNGPFFARNNTDVQNKNAIELWNLESGQFQKLEITSGSEPLRFSPDGSLFAAIRDNRLHIWKTATGQLLYRSDENFSPDGLSGLTFSPDNQSMVVPSEGKAIVWDIRSIAQRAQQANIPDLVPAPTASAPVITWLTPTPQPTSTPVLTSHVAVSGAIIPENAARVKEISRFGAGTVEQVAWSPAGDSLVVAGSLGVFQYNVQNWTETVSRQHTGWTYSAVTLPDGRSLAASADPQTGKVIVWEVATGVSLAELDGGGEPALSPDGSLLTYLDKDGNLQVWDVVQQRALSTLHSSSRIPRHAIFSPDVKLVAAVESSDSPLPYSNSVRIWDARSGAIVNALGGPDNDITDLSFSADGRFMVGAAGGSGWIWQTQPGAAVDSINLYPVTVSYNLNLYDHTVTAAGISPDDKTIALGTSERVIWLYDRQSHTVLSKLEGHAAALTRLRFSPDGKSLLALDKDGTIVIWDTASGKQRGNIETHIGVIGGMVFRQDGNLSVWQAGRVSVLHPGDGKLLQTTQVHGGTILAASPLGDWLAVYDPYRISLWDARTGAFKQTLEGEAQDAPIDYHYEGAILRQFYAASFSPDGSRLATGGTGGVWLYDTTNGQLLQQFPGQDSRKLVFSPDGNQLMTSMFDLTQAPGIFDLQSEKMIFGLDNGEYGYGYTQYAFSTNGRWAGVLSRDQNGAYQLTLWDVPGKKLFKTVTFGQNVPVRSLAFNPDSSIIALGQGDGKIMLLNLSDFTVMATLNGHRWAVEHLAFSPDGFILASSSQDGTLRMWGVQP